jgi:hypothetical protein
MLFAIFIFPSLTATVILGSSLLFRRMGIPSGRFILAAFLVVGFGLGILSALLWPLEPAVYVNVAGTAAGDWLYRISIERFGDPFSAQAHYTIPWVLRIPTVYVISTTVLYAAAGVFFQLLFDRIGKHGRQSDKEES